MFNVGRGPALKRLLSCGEDKLAIFRVNHFADLRKVNGALPRIQSINTVNFVRPKSPDSR